MAGSESKASNTRESKRLRASAGPPTRFEAGGISKMDLLKKGKGKDGAKAQKPANEWTIAEVSNWISSFAFCKQYKAAFEQHEIAGDTLGDIDDDILSDELGIDNARHRKRLLAEINDVLRKAGAGPSNDDDDDSDDDDSSSSSSSDDDSDSTDMEDEPEPKKTSKPSKPTKPKANNAFNFPSDDEQETRSDGSKKSNAAKKRKTSSNGSQSSSSSATKKKAPKKVVVTKARKVVKVVRNGTAKKSRRKVASVKRKGTDTPVAPVGKIICPPCGAAIDKDSAMCMKCFAVFPEKKASQFAATSYYRAYRAVPNYRS